MIGVDKIDDIRRLGRGGASVASIARDTGVSEPTVRKYLREPGLSERPPAVGRAPESPSLEPFAELVDSWLLEDRRRWFKRRHTARRVYDRLVEEQGFDGSYTTVQRYVKRRREELAAELDAREARGFLLLDWLPGECQVDFGQADFRVRGVVQRGHLLVVAFPHSNVGLAQVFWGETAECVCQGLRDVFEFLGGVPLRAVFDNATEVGRRVGAEIRASALFRRFAADVYDWMTVDLGERLHQQATAAFVMGSLSKWTPFYLMFLLPVLALLFKAFYPRRRYMEHFAHATHLSSMFLILLPIPAGICLTHFNLGSHDILPVNTFQEIILNLFPLLMLVYQYISMHTVYREGWGRTAVKCILVYGLFLLFASAVAIVLIVWLVMKVMGVI